MTERTYGERAVGLHFKHFNPSGDERVSYLKTSFATIIDELDRLRSGSTGELARLCSIAITEAQGAQMWAVKAATWKEHERAP